MKSYNPKIITKERMLVQYLGSNLFEVSSNSIDVD